MNVAFELSRDRRIAGSVALGIATVTCLVLQFLTIKIPMPPTPEQLKYKDMEVEFVELEPLSLPETPASAGGGGGGYEVDAPKADSYTEQMQEVLTSKTSSSSGIKSGGSNHTNTKNPTKNPPGTRDPKPENPFGNGGTGGGEDGHQGGGIGNTDGTHTGNTPNATGGGGSGTRNLVQRPDPNDIDSDEDCKIVFLVSINTDGTIAGTPQVVRSKTTTSNTYLISKAASVVKSQTRYNSVKTGGVVKKELTITLTAR